MKPNRKALPAALRVVAVAHTPAGVRLAQGLGARDCGYVEVRLDALLEGRGFKAVDIRQIGPPVLLTPPRAGSEAFPRPGGESVWRSIYP